MPETRAPRYPGASPTSRIGASARESRYCASRLGTRLGAVAVAVEVARPPDPGGNQAIDERAHSDPYSDRRRSAAARRSHSESLRSSTARSRRSTSPSTTSTSAPRRRQSSAEAIGSARRRGVRIRLAYNVDHPMPIPVPPPSEPDVELIASLPVDGKAIAGIPDLMHHKYVVRDGSDVWTGSMNWTDDSWSRQENVVVVVTENPAIAKAYALDFEQLVGDGRCDAERLRRPAVTKTASAPGSRPATARTCRRASRSSSGGHASASASAHPCITTGPVLGTLAQVIADKGVDVAGCVDATQIRDVVRPVEREPQHLLEAPAPRAGDGRPVHREELDALRRRHRARLHAREGLRRATTRRSSARSTSPAAGRRTPRTCSRSRTRRSPTGWPRSSTRSARDTGPSNYQRLPVNQLTPRPAT